MPDRCVCYATDRGYLYTSFVSALQARTHSDPARADVAILAFDLDAATAAAFGSACREAGIDLIRCERGQIGGAPVMMARLFLAELLPPHYRTFLYIDGDTLIGGSLEPLLDQDLSDGRFLAVSDPMTFAVPGSDRHSRSISEHFRSIGLSAAQSALYFNSGVILADRAAWGPIGQAAWAMHARRPQGWMFHDQDLLNIAGAGRHRPMSLAWNFPVYMQNARVAAEIAPRIIHYMSKPKPWEGAFPPWNRAVHRIYLDAGRRFPGIAPYRPTMSARTRLRYQAQQRYKRLVESFTWGMGEKRRRILAYERGVAVARP